jgi:hypothetical protein
MRTPRLLALGCAVAAIFGGGRAMADASPAPRTQFGVRTGVYTDVSAAFIGAEVLTPIASAWYFNPNLEYAAGGVDNDVLTVNGDFHYDFIVDRPYFVWAGGGPAVIFREVQPGDRESDLGVNVLGGIGWKKPQVTPFVQTKITVARDTEAVLALGLRF